MSIQCDHRIVDAMRAAGAAVDVSEARAWRLAVPGGTVFNGYATSDDAWLVLEPLILDAAC